MKILGLYFIPSILQISKSIQWWAVGGSWVAAWPPEQGRTVDPLDCRWSVGSGDGVELPEPGGLRPGAAPLLSLLPAALRTPPVGVSD